MATANKYRTSRCIIYRGDPSGERFLLADHTGRFRPTKWGLPGGHVEWREHPEETARREVLEELNLYLGVLQHVGDYPYKNRLHAVYAGHTDSEDFDLDMSELSAARWFSQPEIKALQQDRRLHAGYEYGAICDFLENRTDPANRSKGQ